jgi:hypothetical protein
LARAREQTQRQRAEEAVERLRLQHAEEAFSTDQSAKGIAELASILRGNPTNRVAAERLLAVLTHQNFLLERRASVIAKLNDAIQNAIGEALDAPASAKPPKLNRSFQFHEPSLALSLESERLITFTHLGPRLWSLRTGEAIGPTLSHTGTTWFAQFSTDGRRAVTTSFDQTARIWDAQTGQALAKPLPHHARLRRHAS